MKVSRRDFLGKTAAALAGGTLGMQVAAASGPMIVTSVMNRGVFGANDRIRACCVGIHGQGNAHIKDLIEEGARAEVAALCDVDSDVLEGRIKEVEKATQKAPKGFKDVREAVAQKDIDVITIATPNHWHSLAAIWACQNGKDVYVEKPLSHNIWEGRQLVAAAEKFGRVVQHGTQSRSNSTLLRDIKLIHEGFIGPISHSRGYVYKNGNRMAIGYGKPGKAPANLDYALWQGPAKEKDYLVKDDGEGLFIHYNWHWFWEWGNGEIGNQGVHEMDVAVWGHNRGLPVRVYSTGGRYGWEDQAETPNTQATSFTYADGSILTFEVRNLGSFPEGGKDNCSNSFFGTKGYYVRGSGFFDYQNKPITVDVPLPESRGRFTRFLDAVVSRKAEDNPAPATVGHISCVHCHLGNIAYRAKRCLEFDPATETFGQDAEANKFLKREYRPGFEVPQIA